MVVFAFSCESPSVTVRSTCALRYLRWTPTQPTPAVEWSTQCQATLEWSSAGQYTGFPIYRGIIVTPVWILLSYSCYAICCISLSRAVFYTVHA